MDGLRRSVSSVLSHLWLCLRRGFWDAWSIIGSRVVWGVVIAVAGGVVSALFSKLGLSKDTGPAIGIGFLSAICTALIIALPILLWSIVRSASRIHDELVDQISDLKSSSLLPSDISIQWDIDHKRQLRPNKFAHFVRIVANTDKTLKGVRVRVIRVRRADKESDLLDNPIDLWTGDVLPGFGENVDILSFGSLQVTGGGRRPRAIPTFDLGPMKTPVEVSMDAQYEIYLEVNAEDTREAREVFIACYSKQLFEAVKWL